MKIYPNSIIDTKKQAREIIKYFYKQHPKSKKKFKIVQYNKYYRRIKMPEEVKEEGNIKNVG